MIVAAQPRRIVVAARYCDDIVAISAAGEASGCYPFLSGLAELKHEDAGIGVPVEMDHIQNAVTIEVTEGGERTPRCICLPKGMISRKKLTGAVAKHYRRRIGVRALVKLTGDDIEVAIGIHISEEDFSR